MLCEEVVTPAIGLIRTMHVGDWARLLVSNFSRDNQLDTALHYTLHYSTALHCTELQCTALYFSELNCIILDSTAIHFTGLKARAKKITAMPKTELHFTFSH